MLYNQIILWGNVNFVKFCFSQTSFFLIIWNHQTPKSCQTEVHQKTEQLTSLTFAKHRSDTKSVSAHKLEHKNQKTVDLWSFALHGHYIVYPSGGTIQFIFQLVKWPILSPFLFFYLYIMVNTHKRKKQHVSDHHHKIFKYWSEPSKLSFSRV